MMGCGLWGATNLLAEKGRALHSMNRTYLLTEGEDHSLKHVLEGTAKTDDVIELPRPDEDRTHLPALARKRLRAGNSIDGAGIRFFT